MRKTMIAAATLAALLAGIETANAFSERVVTGAAFGAGTGALLAGPIGAVAGGVVGGIVGGPRLPRGFTECFRNRKTGEHRCYSR